MRLYNLVLNKNSFNEESESSPEYNTRIDFVYDLFMDKAVLSEIFLNNIKEQIETFNNDIETILKIFDENSLIYNFTNGITVWQTTTKDLQFSVKGVLRVSDNQLDLISELNNKIRKQLLSQGIYIKITNLSLQ